ncbi:nuclear factor 7, brain-like [Conger conger]|uniref:nuclear factor 7, brain-like n=1 Tax=Conger conger TaxID=82655 RepID=UPI002A59DB14|nr:nuclear factor 7, brain-like [Conger conger]
MALSSIPLSEWQFLCTVCQDVFTEPVSTPCGHNFCKACLTGFWDGTDKYQCPLCKKRFEGPMDLGVNAILAQITQDYKRRRLEAPEMESEAEESDDEARSACADQPVEPTLDLKDSVCEKHSRPLELFCSTDHACICTQCAEEDHAGHAAVPVEGEWLRRHEELKTEVLQVKQGILDRQKKTEELKRQMRLSREDAEERMKEGQQTLDAILRSVEKCQSELEEAIEGEQRVVESKAQGLLKELEQEIKGLNCRKAQLKEVSRCRDHVRVLESLPSQPPSPCAKDWDNVLVHPNLRVGTVRSVISPHDKYVRAKMTELVDAEFKKIRHYAVDDILVNGSTWSSFELSKDRKEVHSPSVFANGSQYMFLTRLTVLGEHVFSSGRHYWEVNVEGKTSWHLGVVEETFSRQCRKPMPQNGFWLLHFKEGNSLRALDDSPVQLSLSSELNEVGVYVDYEEGEISFYNVEARSFLFSFTGNTFTEKLCLLLNPRDTDKEPMILSPVSKT